MPQASTVRTDVVFSTSLTIAGQAVDAAVYLASGRPSLIVVDRMPSVSFSGLFNQFVPGSTWPSQAVDVTLKNSAIFYVQQQTGTTPPGLPTDFPVQITNFAPGLYVATTVTLTLGGFSVSAATTIGQVSGQGLTIDVDLAAPVTLFDSNFVVLSDTGFAGAGPNLTVGGGSGTLACGATLFGTSFGAASVTLTGGTEPSLAATLTYAGTLMGVANPSLSFSWDDTDGFQITDFPILVPTALVDIVDELKKISAAAGCGALVALALNQIIQTSFYVSPSVTTVRPPAPTTQPTWPTVQPSWPAGTGAGQPIYVVIAGYYKVTLGDTTPIATIDLPELVLTVPTPGSFSFGSILATIGNFIALNATAVVQQLWNDKPALGALLAAAVAPAVATQVAANLTCAALKKLLNDFLDELPDAPGGGTGGGGAGGGAGSAAQALGAAAAAAAALAGACSAGGNSGGSQVGTALAAPILAPPSFQNGAVTASWSAVSGAVGYRAQLIDQARNVAGPVQFLPAGTLATTFPINPSTFVSGTAFVQVLARAGGNSTAVDSAFASQALQVIMPPTNVGLSWSFGSLLAFWQPGTVGTGPAQYHVRLYDDVAATHLVGEITAAGSSPAAITRTDGAAFAPGQSYRVAVATVAGSSAGPFSAPSPAFPIVAMPTPAKITTTLQGGGVMVSWQAVTNPAGLSGQRIYVAQIVTMAQPAAVIAAAPALSRPGASFPGPLTPGQPYAVRVNVGIGPYIGDWGYSDPFVILGVPVVTGLTYDAAVPAVIVRWQAVPGADSYEVAVRDTFGRLLQPSVSAVVPATGSAPAQALQTATLPGKIASTFSSAGSVTAIVQARRTINQQTSTGAWSQVAAGNNPARLAIQTYAAPATPTGRVAAGVVTVSWTCSSPPAGVVYAVQLLRNRTEVVDAVSTSQTTAVLTLPVSSGGAIGPAGGAGPPAQPGQYAVRVRATTATSLGLWSPELAITVP